MKQKINAIKELFLVVGMVFVLTCLQIWYIITGNE
jgi:hypothetical protein